MRLVWMSCALVWMGTVFRLTDNRCDFTMLFLEEFCDIAIVHKKVVCRCIGAYSSSNAGLRAQYSATPNPGTSTVEAAITFGTTPFSTPLLSKSSGMKDAAANVKMKKSIEEALAIAVSENSFTYPLSNPFASLKRALKKPEVTYADATNATTPQLNSLFSSMLEVTHPKSDLFEVVYGVLVIQ